MAGQVKEKEMMGRSEDAEKGGEDTRIITLLFVNKRHGTPTISFTGAGSDMSCPG